MDIVGYALIKKDAKTGVSAIPIEKFTTQAVRVMEFGHDGCVMVVDPQATGIAIFDKEDVVKSFRCTVLGHFICPPDLNVVDQMIYTAKAGSRKGGYNELVAQLVIGASIHKGEFNDSLLWQKQ